MSIATGTALAIGLGAAGAGSLASGILGSHAAKSAANTQTTAIGQAADALNKQYGVTSGNLAPYLSGGTGALSQLVSGTQPGGSLITPFGETYQTPAPFSYGAFQPGPAFQTPAPFQAPTLDNTNDPGYAFRLQQGQQALQRGAAAGGGAFSGGTLAALTRYGQDYASNEYNNVYQRALQGYNTNFDTSLKGYQTNYGNALDAYKTNLLGALQGYQTNASTGLEGYLTRMNAYNTGQTNQFNRLASLAGYGQNAANTLGNFGQTNAAAIANLLTGAGQARAAGTLGSASAWNSGINSLTGGISNVANLFGLRGLMGGSNVPIGGNIPLYQAAGLPGDENIFMPDLSTVPIAGPPG